MIGKFFRKRRCNDKGMSLVEVMVAITILSISLMAFFRTFVSSAQYDAKSKERQRQLNLSQGIMESFKAYSIEDMYRQFEGLNTFKVYGGTIASYSQSSGASVDANNVFQRDNNNTYQFTLNSLVYDNETYDVTIDVYPKGDARADVADYKKEVNSINKYADAVLIVNENLLNYVYADVASRMTGALDIRDGSHVDPGRVDILSKVNTITLTGTPGDANAEYTVKYEYSVSHYQYMTGLGTFAELDGTFDVTLTGTEINEFSFFNNHDVSGSELRDVYVYFYPEFAAGSESFIINNNVANDLDFFLVKQKPTGLSNTTLQIRESGYFPTVNVNTSGRTVNLHQNLTKRLYGNMPCPVRGGTGGNFSGKIANFNNITQNEDSFMLNEVNNDPTVTGIEEVPQVYEVVITVDGNGETYVLNGSTYSD